MRKVAVITRTKDRPLLLRRAIESVLNQTFTDWTHVIVNDGGNPHVVDKLLTQFKDRYQSRLHLLHHPQSRGMEAASNSGIRESNSELLAIHDDDDTWEPTFLFEMMQQLEAARTANNHVRGIACHSIVINEEIKGDTIVERDRRPFNEWVTAITLWRMLASNFIPPISFLFERSAAEEIGLFDESLPVLGDWDFHIRFLLHHDMALLPAPLAYYHHRRAKDGLYANSVKVRDNKHEATRARYINAKLRNEIVQGRLGPGTLTNIAFHLDGLAANAWAAPTHQSARKRMRRLERLLGIGIAIQLVLLGIMLLR